MKKEINNIELFIFAIVVLFFSFYGFISLLKGLTELKKIEKYKILVNSNKEYGDALKFIKIKGKAIVFYKYKNEYVFCIKPTVFEYKDTIKNMKVFYKDKNENIWFYRYGMGYDNAEISELKVGEWVISNFGEAVFKQIPPPSAPFN